MEAEQFDGNCEYKLKLIGKTDDRLETLASQMRYRMDEGKGDHCYYYLGVADDGSMVGITVPEYDESYDTLTYIADINSYTIELLTTTTVCEEKNIYEIIVREHNEKRYREVKVAITGHVDAGKSSTLAVLLTGNADNGNGRSRSMVFNFPHEVETGRTSSISQQIMGFRGETVVNHAPIISPSWSEIVEQSDKIVTFFDLAGHEMYLKTTIRGITSSYPDFVIVTVSCVKGLQKMTKEHIYLCLSLRIPFIVVITKIDMCKNRTSLKEATDSIKDFMKAPPIRKILYRVFDTGTIITATKNMYNDSVIPYFAISNVDMTGISELTKFLRLVSPNPKNISSPNEELEYHIEKIFRKVVGVGIVLGGHLLSGTLTTGQDVLLGPDDNGDFTTRKIKSLHCKRVPMNQVSGRCYVCVALRKIKDPVVFRRSQVLLTGEAKSVREFDAEIAILKGSTTTTIKVGYQPVVHLNTVRQYCKLLKIWDKKKIRKNKTTESDEGVLRVGDRAMAKFAFGKRPEYIKVGTRVLMAEGIVKILGIIREVY
jgi:elongation factor 1-alpha